MSQDVILKGGKILIDGSLVERDIALIDGKVAMQADVTASAETLDCRGIHIAPGLVDVQVNGGGGHMFSTSSTRSDYEAIARAHASVGSTSICPTIITGPPNEMLAAISLAAEMCGARISGGATFAGIHVEGPFLERKRGGHPAQYLQQPSLSFAQEILDASKGTLAIFTVAPELPGALGVIDLMVEAGVHVSAGHTVAGSDDLHRAAEHGLAGVTHLYNAMEPLSSRAPGPIGVALSSDLYAGLISDFLHVAPDALRVAMIAKSDSLVYLTTDAVSPLGSSAARTFNLYGTEVTVRDGGCYTSDDVLAGTATPLSIMVRLLIDRLDLDPAVALSMATAVPRSLLGSSDCGAIADGASADITLFDEDFNLSRVFVGVGPSSSGMA
ncbi:MAG: N-acetylglucosamine-6-phosphate deacetylase [Candidatus Microthrix sp.]|nr:N-acetylglucosamine-6-phosphate deacetylase [Candidatus Microthrix sp.]